MIQGITRIAQRTGATFSYFAQRDGGEVQVLRASTAEVSLEIECLVKTEICEKLHASRFINGADIDPVLVGTFGLQFVKFGQPGRLIFEYRRFAK